MTVSTTDLVTDVTDYLVAACQAAAVPGGTLAGVTVFDGPQPSAAATGLESVLWVGSNPMNPLEEFGLADQDFPFTGDQGRTRDEHGSIICAAKHWSGDTTMQVHRDACKAIVAGVELLLRGLPASGGPGDVTLGGLVFWAEFAGATWWQSLIDDGGEAFCAFKIAYYGRVSSS